MLKFEVKFVSFTHRDPHLENSKIYNHSTLIKFAVKFSKIGKNIQDKIGVV